MIKIIFMPINEIRTPPLLANYPIGLSGADLYVEWPATKVNVAVLSSGKFVPKLNEGLVLMMVEQKLDRSVWKLCLKDMKGIQKA